jgi:hypothetical protein
VLQSVVTLVTKDSKYFQKSCRKLQEPEVPESSIDLRTSSEKGRKNVMEQLHFYAWV